MKFFSRFLYFPATLMGALIFIIGTVSLVMADNCIQERATPKAPESILKQANPLGNTPENVSAGEKLYQKEAKPLACVQCHEAAGKGDGLLAKGMNPIPRDFSCAAMMNSIPDGQLFWIIKKGSKGTGMMAFNTLSDNQIWQIVNYIRRLAK